MNATAAENLADRFPTSFEEFRNAWDDQEKRKGLAGAFQKVILRLLNALVALLADVRAGAVTDAAPDAPCGADASAGDADVCVADTNHRGGEQSSNLAAQTRQIAGGVDEATRPSRRPSPAVALPPPPPAPARAGAGRMASMVRWHHPHPGPPPLQRESEMIRREARIVRLLTPHPPASDPIFASKNGSPSRAPPSPPMQKWGSWRGRYRVHFVTFS